jgi:hypothetical protein
MHKLIWRIPKLFTPNRNITYLQKLLHPIKETFEIKLSKTNLSKHNYIRPTYLNQHKNGQTTNLLPPIAANPRLKGLRFTFFHCLFYPHLPNLFINQKFPIHNVHWKTEHLLTQHATSHIIAKQRRKQTTNKRWQRKSHQTLKATIPFNLVKRNIVHSHRKMLQSNKERLNNDNNAKRQTKQSVAAEHAPTPHSIKP